MSISKVVDSNPINKVDNGNFKFKSNQMIYCTFELKSNNQSIKNNWNHMLWVFTLNKNVPLEIFTNTFKSNQIFKITSNYKPVIIYNHTQIKSFEHFYIKKNHVVFDFYTFKLIHMTLLII